MVTMSRDGMARVFMGIMGISGGRVFMGLGAAMITDSITNLAGGGPRAAAPHTALAEDFTAAGDLLTEEAGAMAAAATADERSDH